MKDKLKVIFDSRATWATLGVFAGSILGEKAAAIVNAFGALVMAAI